MHLKHTRLSLPLDLSRVSKRACATPCAKERHRRWLDENREAFEAANRFIEKSGIFNADDREW